MWPHEGHAAAGFAPLASTSTASTSLMLVSLTSQCSEPSNVEMVHGASGVVLQYLE